MSKLNVPQLRFSEFSGEWEETVVKNVLDTLIDCEHKTAPYVEYSKYLVVRTNNVKNGRLSYDEMKYTSYEGYKEWTQRKVPSHNDVLFTREAPAGESCLVPANKTICLGQRMVLLQPNLQKITTSFLLWFLQSNIGKKRIQKFVIGTTVTRINIKDIYRINCFIPSLLEQEKIASFLTAVDSKIEQLTQKQTLLQDYKKGVMQKIFSQEIRFKANDGSVFAEWEEKKLKEVLTIGSGKDYKHLDEGSIPVYGSGGYMTSVNNYLYDGESVCIGRKGTIDKPMFKSGKFWTVDTLFYTHSFKGTLPKFVYYIFQRVNWRKYSEASGVPSLSKSTIESIKVSIPTIEEQVKIATFLTSIDTKIDHNSKQLDQVKQFKKALLQQMFV